MFITITYIELRSPIKYPALVSHAMKIALQLRNTSCLAYKFRGFWTKHYTITSWDSMEAMKGFARSGAHLEAMKKSVRISKEIRTLTITATTLPKWNEAKALLFKDGKILKF